MERKVQALILNFLSVHCDDRECTEMPVSALECHRALNCCFNEQASHCTPYRLRASDRECTEMTGTTGTIGCALRCLLVHWDRECRSISDCTRHLSALSIVPQLSQCTEMLASNCPSMPVSALGREGVHLFVPTQSKATGRAK